MCNVKHLMAWHSHYVHMHMCIHVWLCVKTCLRVLLLNMGVLHWECCMVYGKQSAVKYGNKLDLIWFDLKVIRRYFIFNRTTWVQHQTLVNYKGSMGATVSCLKLHAIKLSCNSFLFGMDKRDSRSRKHAMSGNVLFKSKMHRSIAINGKWNKMDTG